MKRIAAYILFGLVVYCVALVTKLPAAYLYQQYEEQLAAQLPRLKIEGVAGTVWQGEIGQLSYDGHRLGHLQWTIRPLYLLLGSLVVDSSLRQGEEYVSGQLSASLPAAKQLTIEGMDGRLGADYLAAFIPYVPVVPKGEFIMRLESAEVVDLRPISAIGKVVWSDAGTQAPQSLEFGTLSMTLSPLEQGGVEGSLNDQGGALRLDGKVTLDREGNYKLASTIGAGVGASQELRNSLGMLGRPDREGRYHLNFNGKLK